MGKRLSEWKKLFGRPLKDRRRRLRGTPGKEEGRNSKNRGDVTRVFRQVSCYGVYHWFKVDGYGRS